MTKHLFKDAFVWGFALWCIGYVLGILLFMVVPHHLIGWSIMPVGIILTLWVLIKKIKTSSFSDYIFVAIGWTLMAVIFDYMFLVKVFTPSDGYYKLDVYLYYAFTFILPLLVGWRKSDDNL